MLLALEDIRLDGNTQLRDGLNQDLVKEYAQSMQDGAVFPPAIVYYDETSYWLADGFHRHAAVELNEWEALEVEVRYGTKQDAIDYACGANATHGQRRTNKHKRLAVETMLINHTAWSDGKIAKQCVVSQPFVSEVRREMVTHNRFESTQIREGADGRVYTIGTAKALQEAYPELVNEVVRRARKGYVPEDEAGRRKMEEELLIKEEEYKGEFQKRMRDMKDEHNRRINELEESHQRILSGMRRDRVGLKAIIEQLQREAQGMKSSGAGENEVTQVEEQIRKKRDELKELNRQHDVLEREFNEKRVRANVRSSFAASGMWVTDLMARMPLDVEVPSLEQDELLIIQEMIIQWRNAIDTAEHKLLVWQQSRSSNNHHEVEGYLAVVESE